MHIQGSHSIHERGILSFETQKSDQTEMQIPCISDVTNWTNQFLTATVFRNETFILIEKYTCNRYTMLVFRRLSH